MTAAPKDDTHTAYAFSRLGRNMAECLECGTGR